MSDYEFTLSLRIRHPRIEPAEITRSLAMEPQHSWRAGEKRRDAAGAELSGEYHETLWMCALMTRPALSTGVIGVESQLLQSIGTLRRSQEFLRSLRDSGGFAEIHISLFTRREVLLELPPELLVTLGQLGITVALEVSPHSASAAPGPVHQ